jgi:hypothetical protein
MQGVASAPGPHHTPQPYRNRRGGKGTPKVCSNCHFLAAKPYHYCGKDKIDVGPNHCIWQQCPAQAGADYKCSMKGCKCYEPDPAEVLQHREQKVEAARLAAEQLIGPSLGKPHG